MKSQRKHTATLLLLVIVTLQLSTSSVAHAGEGGLSLDDRDRALIMESVLKRELAGKVKRCVLSTENIDPRLLPRISGVKIVPLDPDKIQERAKLSGGFKYLAFTKFEVQGTKVVVIVEYTWSGDNTWKGGSTYEYIKTSGRWRWKRTKLSPPIGRKCKEVYAQHEA